MWLDKIFDYRVERREITRPGHKPYYPMAQTGIGVLHTTEGGSTEGAFQTLSVNRDAPHFVIGPHRIIQCRPIGFQAAALHALDNRRAYVQIEIVAKSQLTLWLPDECVVEPLVALLAFCEQNCGIPLRVPCNWPDDCSDLKGQIWAGFNSRRRTASKGAWNSEKGWWMHLECPVEQPSWHYDCGALRRSELLKMASDLLRPAPLDQALAAIAGEVSPKTS